MLCDTMATQLKRCGQEVSSEELSTCYQQYEQVREVDETRCQLQNPATLEQNLSLRGGSEDPCVALEAYAAP